MTRWKILAGLVFTLGLGGRAMAQGCTIGKLAELPVTMVSLQPTIQARMDGHDVRLLLDTGAFHSMLSPSTAERLKLGVIGSVGIVGFSGGERVGVANVKNFELAGASRRATQFVVGHGVDDLDGLLGDDILGAFDVEYDLANGVIRFLRANGCQGAALAYWTVDKPVAVARLGHPYGNPQALAAAMINDRPLQVMLDTGSSTSFLRTRSAQRLGVLTAGGNVTRDESTRGIGAAEVRTSIAPIDSFEIGGEKVLHTRVRIGDGNVLDADMLLGADFFLSHRILISNSTKQIVFTYNGGPVFDLPPVDRALATTAAPKAPGDVAGAPPPAASDPADADGWSRRGVARQARGDWSGALADLTQAVTLAPKETRYRVERATLYTQTRRPQPALTDLDAAVVLKPTDTDLRIQRAELRIRVGDMSGAKDDLAAVAPSFKSKAQQLQLAMLYTRAEQFDTSLGMLDHWVADRPRSVELGYGLAVRCWARVLAKRDLDAALADCDRAARLTDDAEVALQARGLLYVRRGEYDRALHDFNAALETAPKDGWALYGRSLAEVGTGGHAAADKDRAALAVIDPDLPTEAARYGLTP